MKVDVTSLEAKKVGTVDLPDTVFGLDPRADIIHRMVTYQLARRQAGTHKTKGRAEIRGSTRKIQRQKGSGGARHGNRKVPQYRGGGRAFGPVVRSHATGLPKKIRALALKHALSSKMKAGTLVVLDEAKSREGKTSVLRSALGKLGLDSVLIVDGPALDENFERAARNIPRVDVLPAQGINVYDILHCENLVLTKAALESLEARFS